MSSADMKMELLVDGLTNMVEEAYREGLVDADNRKINIDTWERSDVKERLYELLDGEVNDV